MMAPSHQSTLSILGAAPDTNNLGVRALLASALNAIDTYEENVRVSVFDNGFGTRSAEVDIGGSGRRVDLIGARVSKRLHRSDTMANIAISGQFGLGSNPAVNAIRASGAALDISAGDSFSDIYGWTRFSHVLLQKQVCLRQGTPLVLMPQTYGPYRSAVALRLATRILRRANIAIARDRNSYEYLQELLAADFDEDRHRLGVDLAFGLPAARPELRDELEDFFREHETVIGLNISGLLYHDADSAKRFGLADDYRKTVRMAVERLLARTTAGVLLVPHVISPRGRPESDIEACLLLRSELSAWGSRLSVADAPRTASEAKGLIARTDWFAGSRMHSTIAALSSCVPAAAIAYSGKANGVFASAGVGAHVVDLRSNQAEVVSEMLIASFDGRDEARTKLDSIVPSLRKRAVLQVVEALQAVGFEHDVMGRA